MTEHRAHVSVEGPVFVFVVMCSWQWTQVNVTGPSESSVGTTSWVATGGGALYSGPWSAKNIEKCYSAQNTYLQKILKKWYSVLGTFIPNQSPFHYIHMFEKFLFCFINRSICNFTKFGIAWTLIEPPWFHTCSVMTEVRLKTFWTKPLDMVDWIMLFS